VEVAREIAVVPQSLGRWVKAEIARCEPGPDRLTESERAELERLRRENRDLRMDVEFLGKAAAFFASKNISKTPSN
jgi:transposase